MLKFFDITNISNTIITAFFVGISYIFGPILISIFTKDSQISALAYNALKIACLSYFAVGLSLRWRHLRRQRLRSDTWLPARRAWRRPSQ